MLKSVNDFFYHFFKFTKKILPLASSILVVFIAYKNMFYNSYDGGTFLADSVKSFRLEWLDSFFSWFDFSVSLSKKLTNFSVHLLAGLSIFYLVNLICNSNSKRTFLKNNSSWISLLSSTLFLLQPFQQQAYFSVFYAREMALSVLLSVSSLIFIFNALKSLDPWKKNVWAFFSAMLNLVLASFSNLALTTPLLALFLDYNFVSDLKLDRFKRNFYYHIMLLASGLTSLKVHGFSLASYKHLINLPKALISSVYALVSPSSLNNLQSYKLVNSVSDLTFLFSLSLLVALVVLSFKFLRKKDLQLTLFGFLSSTVIFLVNSLLYPTSAIVSSNIIYFISVWMMVTFATLLVWVFESVANYIFEFIVAKSRKNSLPANINVTYSPADKLIRMKKTGDAVFTYHKDDSLYLRGLMIFLLAGVHLGQVGYDFSSTWKDSISFWTDMSISNPNQNWIHSNLGLAFFELGDYSNAIQEYKKALNFDGKCCDTWNKLAVAYAQSGQDQLALKTLNDAITLNPNYPEFYDNLAILNFKNGNLDGVDKLLQKALDLDPKYGKAHNDLGVYHLSKNEDWLAWNCFKNATGSGFKEKKCLENLADLSMKFEKYDDAVIAYQEILKYDDKNSQVKSALASAHYNLSNYQDAEELYQELCFDNPREDKYKFGLAESLFAKGDYHSSKNLYTLLAETNSEFPVESRLAQCEAQKTEF